MRDLAELLDERLARLEHESKEIWRLHCDTAVGTGELDAFVCRSDNLSNEYCVSRLRVATVSQSGSGQSGWILVSRYIASHKTLVPSIWGRNAFSGCTMLGNNLRYYSSMHSVQLW